MCSIASEISVLTGAARTDSFSPSDGSFASGFSFCPLWRQIVKYAVTATTRFSAVDNAAAPLQASNASIAIHAQSTEATSNRNLTRSRIYFLEQHDSGQTHSGIIGSTPARLALSEKDQQCAILKVGRTSSSAEGLLTRLAIPSPSVCGQTRHLPAHCERWINTTSPEQAPCCRLQSFRFGRLACFSHGAGDLGPRRSYFHFDHPGIADPIGNHPNRPAFQLELFFSPIFSPHEHQTLSPAVRVRAQREPLQDCPIPSMNRHSSPRSGIRVDRSIQTNCD
jgi:hypothetical protein